MQRRMIPLSQLQPLLCAVSTAAIAPVCTSIVHRGFDAELRTSDLIPLGCCQLMAQSFDCTFS